jgi:hypothetical protein
VVFPALYPLPSWLVAALRTRWGPPWAMYLSSCALPLGFIAQMCERWALGFYCRPDAWVRQPTAVLHAATGLTITAAYVHARSVQD